MRGLGRAWQSTMMSIPSPTASRIAATHASACRIGARPSSGIVGGTAIDLNAVKPCSTIAAGELAEALRLVALVEVLHLAAAEVPVQPDVVSHGAAPQLVAGNAVHLAEDVPERDVDPAHRRAADDVVAVPEVLPEHHLPQVLDPRRVLADDQLGEVLDGAHDGACVPLERGLAPAVETGLVRQDADEDPVAHARVADVRLDRRRSSRGAPDALEQRDALVDQLRHPAAVDVRVRDPVGPAVSVLVEDVVERDIGDEIEVGVRARNNRRSRSSSRARASARTGCGSGSPHRAR